jgi:hypothetical protein
MLSVRRLGGQAQSMEHPLKKNPIPHRAASSVYLSFTLSLAAATLASAATWDTLDVAVVGVRTIAASGTTLWFGGNVNQTMLYKSDDSGKTLVSSATGIASYTPIYGIGENHGVLLAGSAGTAMRSTDGGANWSMAKTGFPTSGTLFGVEKYLTRNDTTFAAVDVGANGSNVYMSVDTGKTWSGMGFSAAADCRSIAAMGGLLFAGTQYNGVYRSTGITLANGVQWTQAASGLPLGQGTLLATVGSLAAIDTVLFASAGKGIYRSADRGDHWTGVDSTLAAAGPVCASGSDLFWASDSIYRSKDMGATWQGMGAIAQARSLYVFGGYLFVGGPLGTYRTSLTAGPTAIRHPAAAALKSGNPGRRFDLRGKRWGRAPVK